MTKKIIKKLEKIEMMLERAADKSKTECGESRYFTAGDFCGKTIQYIRMAMRIEKEG